MKNINPLQKILNHKEFATKIKIYFSSKAAGDDFDPYENNYTFTNLNYHTIKAYVSQMNPSSLVWKEFGLEEQGAIEVLCDKKYLTWFENANKIEISSKEYEVFKEATGGRSIITTRPFNMIRVVLRRR